MSKLKELVEKATPGPWRLSSQGASIQATDIVFQCTVCRLDGISKREFNARLTTKAPELAALAVELADANQKIIDWMLLAEAELNGPLPVGYAARVKKPVVVERLRAAIAKVKALEESL